MKIVKSTILLLLAFGLIGSVFAQDEFAFESITDVKTTLVKDQGLTGTCWAFSTISFVESEIMRMGGPELDLSEMYIVKHAYERKAQQYVFLHGKGNFSEGGQAHDVMNVIENYGFVQESDYPGRQDASMPHDHSEMVMTMKVMLDNYMEQKGAVPSDLWFTNIYSVLNNKLGESPKQIGFNKRSYSPVQFAQGLGIDHSNYIELSSYSHHPFYSLFDLEVPDNWSHDRYYNVPVGELVEAMKSALKKGYSLVWDGDVSEDFFSHREGVAFLPVDKKKGFVPQEEKNVTQEDRQKAFLSWQATDDHLMHIVGLAKDKNGTIYFKIKNSWGSDSNRIGGFLYMSEAYVRMNTVAVMLHKDALEKELTKKLLNE